MKNSGANHQEFTEQPLKRRLDPRLVYRSPGARQAYTEIVEGLRNRAGLIVLTGAAGSGKTMLSQLCATELAAAAQFVTFTEIPSTFDDALGRICKNLDLNTADIEPVQLLPLLKNFLLEQAQQNRTTVVVIEDAHELPNYVLNKLLTLCKTATSETTLLSIVLLGLPELDAKLQQLNLQDKVQIRCRLDYLRDAEVNAFIQHRTHAAGYTDTNLFSPQAIQRITAYSEGSPLVINTLCDTALSIARGRDRQTVTAEIVDEAARQGSPQESRPPTADNTNREHRAVSLKKLYRTGRNPDKPDKPSRTVLWAGIALTLLLCAVSTIYFLMISIESQPLATITGPVPPINSTMSVIATERLAQTDEAVDRNPSSIETVVAPITLPTGVPEIINAVAALPVIAPSPTRQAVAVGAHRETTAETDSAPDVLSAPLTALAGIKQSKQARRQTAAVFAELRESQ